MQTEYRVHYSIITLIDGYGRIGITSEGSSLHALTIETFVERGKDPYTSINFELFRKFGIIGTDIPRILNLTTQTEEKTINHGVLKKVSMYICQIKSKTTLKLINYNKNTLNFFNLDDITNKLLYKDITLSYCGQRMLSFIGKQGFVR